MSNIKNPHLRLSALRPEEKKIEEQEHLNTALESATITDLTEIPRETPLIFLKDSNGDPTSVCSIGDFSLFIGKAKSKKTFFLSLIVGRVLNGNQSGTITSEMPEDRARILYFDTEQKASDVKALRSRINAISLKNKNTNLLMFSLRPYSASERFKMIEFALQHYSGKYCLVVIDGIRDILTSINDEEQASHVSGSLLKWSTQYDCHIITVLHQNKGDNNARGHIGTELINKAESVISIEVDKQNKSISTDRAEYCRHKEPEDVSFIINENSLPEIIENFNTKNLADLPENEITAFIQLLFDNGQKQFTSSELEKQIRNELAKRDLSSSIEKIRAIKSKAMELNLIRFVQKGKAKIWQFDNQMKIK
jgi:hypothetical protein